MSQLKNLCLTLADAYGQHDSDSARIVSKMLRDHAKDGSALIPTEVQSITEHLDTALNNASAMQPVTDAIAACKNEITWRRPIPDIIKPPLADIMASCAIMGPNGMIHAEEAACGFFFMEPNAYYLNHSHLTIELYMVISGTANWSQSRNMLQPKPPGSFMLHDSHEHHATQTTKEPLLAMWSWIGDLGNAEYTLYDD